MRAVATVAVATALAGACAKGSPAPAGTPVPRPSESPVPRRSENSGDVWLAGLRVAADPNDLDRDARTVRNAVGGAAVVSPLACFGRVPSGFDRGDYVLGVVAGSRKELDRLVAATGLDPLFEVSVAQLCLD